MDKQKNMAQFLYSDKLLENIRQKSLETKRSLWACSPCLGPNAHEIFSQEILKNPPADIRFVVALSESSVNKREVSPYEVQYFLEHFGSASVKSMDGFNSNIYIFDDSALITSACLAKTAFVGNIEVGVVLDKAQVDELKNFFDQSLWQHSKPVGDLRKLKPIWNLTQKKAENVNLKKVKLQEQISGWTDEYVTKWYIAVPFQLPAKTERKIRKEMEWQNEVEVLGDVGYQTFKELKLGDLAYLADFKNKRGKAKIELARILDKIKLETDEGDLHAIYRTEKNYFLETEQFFEMLKNAGINPSKTFETKLNQDQTAIVTEVLSSIRRKKKRKTK